MTILKIQHVCYKLIALLESQQNICSVSGIIILFSFTIEIGNTLGPFSRDVRDIQRGISEAKTLKL